MKYLWLFFLPLLYLPNLTYANETTYGTLSMSDYFIGPYLVCVFWRTKPNWFTRLEPTSKLYIHYLVPLFSGFIWWAFISTMTISFRYDYSSLYYVNFGFFKIAKLSLYMIAAILTSIALSHTSKREYQGFLWALLASGLLVGGGLLLTGNSLEGNLTAGEIPSETLFSNNATSVMLSMLIVFFAGMLVKGKESLIWQHLTAVSLIIIILGFVSARGRGGWVAAIIGLLFIAANINIKQTLKVTLIVGVLIIYAYNTNYVFRTEVDKTIQPNRVDSSYYDEIGLGIDDGARLAILDAEFPRIFQAPLLGRGMFHRGGLSGISPTGGHNFYLQIFLETGIPGGTIMLLIMRQMWVSASTDQIKRKGLDIPVKAAFITAFIAGNSGEYFYGGMIIFTLFVIYALIGCNPMVTNSRYAQSISN